MASKCVAALSLLSSSLVHCKYVIIPWITVKKWKNCFTSPFSDWLVGRSQFRKQLKEAGCWVLQQVTLKGHIVNLSDLLSVPLYISRFKLLHFIRKEGPLSLFSFLDFTFHFSPYHIQKKYSCCRLWNYDPLHQDKITYHQIFNSKSHSLLARHISI